MHALVTMQVDQELGPDINARTTWTPAQQVSDGPIHFRSYQGMDKWDVHMQVKG